MVDHYLNTTYTDERIINYIHNNLSYHFEASDDGSVQVYSWDHDSTINNRYFVEIGKHFSLDTRIYQDTDPNDLNQYSSPFDFVLNKPCDTLELAITSVGIDANNEAAIKINGKNTIAIPKPLDKNAGKSSILLDFKKNYLTVGNNSIMFIYYSPIDSYEDATKGYLIKSINIISHYKTQ